MSATDPVPKASLAPNGSIATSMLAGALVIIMVWLVKIITKVDIPPTVQDAFTIVFMAAGAWAHPEGRVPKAP